ncbi:MAG: AraC family transcriptional regulator [Lyngbya sp. HA4199-MV5]|jgi:AraC family transcriptional regulator|nr:AraC family transcriptional regulator [Lyngbya sp. HA4199-MV5]
MPTTARLLQVDMAEHTKPALADNPVLSSQGSGWHGIFFNHYDHSAHESPEHQWMQHVIGITGQGGHPGQSEHQIEGQIQTCYCEPGEMLLIPAGMRYASYWQQAGEFSLLGFSPQFFEQVAHESVGVKPVELIPHIGIRDPLVQQIGLALKSDVEAKHPAGRMFGESLVTGLIIHLLKQYSVWQPQSFSEHKSLSQSQSQTVLDYLLTHLDQDIALPDVAAVLNLSQYHFCRLFKQSTGITPYQYLTRCRIDHAKQLLRTTRLTITEIAFAVGLTNHSSFTRLFRQYVGMTPKKFRTLR